MWWTIYEKQHPYEYYRFFFLNIGESFNGLNCFVQKYNILSDAQNGFRGGSSMETSSQSFI